MRESERIHTDRVKSESEISKRDAGTNFVQKVILCPPIMYVTHNGWTISIPALNSQCNDTHSITRVRSHAHSLGSLAFQQQQSTKTISTDDSVRALGTEIHKKTGWNKKIQSCRFGYRNTHSKSPCKLIISDSPHAILLRNNFWHFAYTIYVHVSEHSRENQQYESDSERVCLCVAWCGVLTWAKCK